MANDEAVTKKLEEIRKNIQDGKSYMGNSSQLEEDLKEPENQPESEKAPEEEKKPENSGNEPSSEEKPAENQPDNQPQENSIDELQERLKNQDELILNQKKRIDLDNAKRGDQGRKIKDAMEKAEKLEKELALAKAKKDQNTDDLPEPPEPPALENDGDIYDEDFRKKEVEYLKKRQNYDKQMKDYIANIAKDKYDLQEKLGKYESTLNDYQEFKQKSEQERKEKEISAKEQKLFAEIEGFQNNHPEYKTTMSIKEISQRLNNFDLNAKDDPTQLQKKNNYIATLPKKDIENYKKVRNMVDLYSPYDKRGLDSFDEAYLIYQNRNGGKEKEAERLIKEKRKTQEETINAMNNKENVSEIPPDKIVTEEERFKSMTKEEKIKRLQVLNAEAGKNPAQFQNNKELYKEWIHLRGSLGIPGVVT